jgi:hypothetical protein
MDPLTNNSRSAHGVISEPHMRTPDRKGREGKGVRKGKGTRRASFTSWRLVSNARDRDAMMTLRARWSA